MDGGPFVFAKNLRVPLPDQVWFLSTRKICSDGIQTVKIYYEPSYDFVVDFGCWSIIGFGP